MKNKTTKSREQQINDLEKDADSKYKKYKRYFIEAIIVVLVLPYLLTRDLCPINFDAETGAIGDTVGGLLGPFVALIAAWLTFMAFWTQYKANLELQKTNIIQQKEIELDHFESRVYEMLSLHRQNVSEVTTGIDSGRKAFVELYAEFFFSHQIINKLLDKISKRNLEINTYIKDLKKNNKFEEYSYKTSYSYFFYGKDYYQKGYNRILDLICEEINNEISLLNGLFEPTNNDIYKYSSQFQFLENSNLSIDIKNIIESKNSESSYKGHYPLFRGYNSMLGHYYRHLFHVVKFVAETKDELISECNIYQYNKIIRGQLSDYEQLLLFYNSLSDMGCEWNKSRLPLLYQIKKMNRVGLFKQINKMGYIARFKLIKNIPPLGIYFSYQPEDKYEKEVTIWKKLDSDFFENI